MVDNCEKTCNSGAAPSDSAWTFWNVADPNYEPKDEGLAGCISSGAAVSQHRETYRLKAINGHIELIDLAEAEQNLDEDQLIKQEAVCLLRSAGRHHDLVDVFASNGGISTSAAAFPCDPVMLLPMLNTSHRWWGPKPLFASRTVGMSHSSSGA